MVERSFVQEISDKRNFGRLARDAGVEGPFSNVGQVVPMHYETLAAVRKAWDAGVLSDET